MLESNLMLMGPTFVGSYVLGEQYVLQESFAMECMCFAGGTCILSAGSGKISIIFRWNVPCCLTVAAKNISC